MHILPDVFERIGTYLVYVYARIFVSICTFCTYMSVLKAHKDSPQDYVFFIPPPQHYGGTPSAFSPSIDECWYGRVNLIFKMQVLTDGGRLKECQCALI